MGSVVVAPRLWRTGSIIVVYGLVAPHTWDLPRSEIEPVSPALAGEIFTTETPEKLPKVFFPPLKSLDQSIL